MARIKALSAYKMAKCIYDREDNAYNKKNSHKTADHGYPSHVYG